MRLKLTVIVMGLLVCTNSYAVQCQLRNIRGVDFRNYDPLANNADNASGRLTFRCRRQGSPPGTVVNYAITLSQGQANSYNPRAMLNTQNSDELSYNMFTNSGRTQIWGDGSGNTVAVNGSFTLNNNSWQQTRPRVYGQIPPGENASAGTYADLITITVTY